MTLEVLLLALALAKMMEHPFLLALEVHFLPQVLVESYHSMQVQGLSEVKYSLNLAQVLLVLAVPSPSNQVILVTIWEVVWLFLVEPSLLEAPFFSTEELQMKELVGHWSLPLVRVRVDRLAPW